MNKSTWSRTTCPRFVDMALPENIDVAVIGGGITGLSVAWMLLDAGKSVCLLERDRIGSGDTSHTTAHLTAVTDLRLKKLTRTFGDEGAKLVWQAGSTAIDAIESIVDENKLDCDFQRVPGFLHSSLTAHNDERKKLQNEAELAASLGINAQFLDKVPLVERPGIRFPDQAKFQPMAYLTGLARLLAERGCVIRESAEVKDVEASPLAVKTAKARIRCGYLVIATHVPLMGIAGLASAALFQTKLASYSSYVVAGELPRGSVPEICLWDTSDPYFYLRVDRGNRKDRVIFGGEDHKTGQSADPPKSFERLASVLHGIIPNAEITRQWSGQVVETNDGLPYIGETAERQFVATGFAGNGMTFGTIAAMMARDQVLGHDNPWRELFAVNRKKLRGGTWNYLKENVDYPYYYLKDRLVSPEAKSTRAVRRGEGKIISLEGSRVACSRDGRGKLSMVAAECTHMGCVVRWNNAEQTWDCPCHGSRFRPTGEVLAGPAEDPLPLVAKQQESSSANGRRQKPPRRRSASSNKGR